jgi:hypothetical protein
MPDSDTPSHPSPTPPSLTRRTLLMGSALIGPLGGAVGAPAPAAAAVRRPRSPYVPYGPSSYLRSRVTGAKVDVAATSQFQDFMASFPEQASVPYPKIMGTGDNRWGIPWARGTLADPVWRIRNVSGVVDPRISFLRTRGFRAPGWIADVITGTSDSPLCVMDRASKFTAFFTGASVAGDHLLDVTSAGVTHHASNGLDHRNRRSDGPRNFTSRGRISDAMVIRRKLVDHGIKHGTDLGHVLHLFLVETSSADGFQHPMVGAESGKSGFGAEGQRLAIRADVDLAARKLSPAGLVIARTLQNRGCYIGDNSGSMSALKAEQETDKHPVWGRLLHQDSLRGLRWEDFVVLA